MKTTVTIEDVKRNMQDVLCETRTEFGKPTTYVTVMMRNGFTLRESTTCVDPANYSEEIGKEICLKRIEEKIWFLLGYQLQEELYRYKYKYGAYPQEICVREAPNCGDLTDYKKAPMPSFPYKAMEDVLKEAIKDWKSIGNSKNEVPKEKTYKPLTKEGAYGTVTIKPEGRLTVSDGATFKGVINTQPDEKEISKKDFLNKEKKELNHYVQMLFIAGKIQFTGDEIKAGKLVTRILAVMKEFYPYAIISYTPRSITLL